MKLVVLLALLTVSEGSTSVSGRTGQNITLSCKYDIKHHGALSACWNRGEIPLGGCKNKLISTDGHRVIKETGASSRYQLVGRLDEGDISLTILNVSEGDSGRYGCRVDIPWWFNDEKHHFDVTVMRAAETTTTTTTPKMSTLNREMTTEESTHTSTAGHVTSTSLQTSSSNSVETEQHRSGAVVVVFIVLGLVFLVTAGGVVIIARRWRRLNKISQQQQHTSDQFNPTSSTLQLHTRGSAVENIYQIDVGTDGGEYEYCP